MFLLQNFWNFCFEIFQLQDLQRLLCFQKCKTFYFRTCVRQIWNFAWVTGDRWRTLSRVSDLPRCYDEWRARTAEVQGCATTRWRRRRRAAHKHSHSNIRLTLMRIGALRVPSDGRQYRRAEGLASGETVKATLVIVELRCVSGEISRRGRRAGRQAHRRAATGGGLAGLRRVGRATCHGAASALFAPCSPTYSAVAVLLSAGGRDGGARCTAPLHSACPPRWAPSHDPLLTPRTRPAPKNFPHRAGKIDCAAGPE